MANEQHVMRQDGKEAFCTAVLLGGGIIVGSQSHRLNNGLSKYME